MDVSEAMLYRRDKELTDSPDIRQWAAVTIQRWFRNLTSNLAEYPTSTAWKDAAILHTSSSFDKFISDEVLIARTIMNRSSLTSLSEDQQQRIMRIRNGVNGGARSEHGLIPSSGVSNEQVPITSTGASISGSSQDVITDDNPRKVFLVGDPKPNVSPDISEPMHRPFHGDDTTILDDTKVTGSGQSSVDMTGGCENELQNGGLHTKQLEIHTSFTTPKQHNTIGPSSVKYSSSAIAKHRSFPLTSSSPILESYSAEYKYLSSHDKEKFSPTNQKLSSYKPKKDNTDVDGKCIDTGGCKQFGQSGNLKLNKIGSSLFCEQNECSYSQDFMPNVLMCHNAKKEDSYKRIYDEKRRRNEIEPFPKSVPSASGYLNHHLKSLTLGRKGTPHDQLTSPTLKLPYLQRSNGLTSTRNEISDTSLTRLQNTSKLLQWNENGGGQKRFQRSFPRTQYSLLSRSWPQTPQDNTGGYSRPGVCRRGNLTSYHQYQQKTKSEEWL